MNTSEGQVEVEQHRFVEKPVNTSSGVTSVVAGSLGEKQRKQVTLSQGKELATWAQLKVSRARLYKVLAGASEMAGWEG